MLNDRTWLLLGRKMSGEAKPEELRELEEILKQDPELYFSLHAIYDLWSQAPPEPSTDPEEAYATHIQRMRDRGVEGPFQDASTLTNDVDRPLSRNIPTTRMLVGFIAISLIAFVIWVTTTLVMPEPKPGLAHASSSEISTNNGSKTHIVLPDGTKVWLNAGSKLTYDKKFGEKIREVELTGEAYFDVAHNAAKPFTIHTRAMDIKVLGTEFNVKSYPEDHTTETSLVRGSIEVTLKDKHAKKIILKPNEKLLIADEQAMPSTPTAEPQRSETINKPIISLSHLNYSSLDSTILETSWVQNRLVFEDESFKDLTVRMSRWYGVQFEFEDPSLEATRFTGNFKDETVADALDAMKITARFNYRVNDNIIYLYK